VSSRRGRWGAREGKACGIQEIRTKAISHVEDHHLCIVRDGCPDQIKVQDFFFAVSLNTKGNHAALLAQQSLGQFYGHRLAALCTAHRGGQTQKVPKRDSLGSCDKSPGGGRSLVLEQVGDRKVVD
jgi:hypothetical protein